MTHTNWFEGCKTVEEIRSRYHKLAMQYHPDRGGSHQTMCDINAAYEAACKFYVRNDKKAYARYTTSDAREAYYSAQDILNEKIRIIIERLVKLGGLNVELCGSWIWVDGNTRPHKETLKALGGRWSKDKGKWYFVGAPSHGYRRYTMDEIRSFHGSKFYAKAEEEV